MSEEVFCKFHRNEFSQSCYICAKDKELEDLRQMLEEKEKELGEQREFPYTLGECHAKITQAEDKLRESEAREAVVNPVLQFYADIENWKNFFQSPSILDYGRRARLAISPSPSPLLELVREMKEYLAHDKECILNYWEAGEPTPDGGYRTKIKGVWYQSKPIDETPKCNCGLDKALESYKRWEEK